MKKNSMLAKIVSITSCVALLVATFPNHARAGSCAGDSFVPSVAAQDCDCSDLNFNCGGPKITPFAGYHVCVTTNDSGVVSCADDPQVEFYSSVPCESSWSFWGVAGCVATLLVLGGFDVGVCMTAGVFTGGLACYAVIAGTAVGGIAACRYCAFHNCGASATGMTHEMRTPSHPDSNSGTCPSA